MDKISFGRLLSDPLFRRWVLGRVRKRWTAPEPLIAHCPPYLTGGTVVEAAKGGIKEQPGVSAPAAAITLLLPGEHVTVEPGEAEALFSRRFADPETGRGLHSFAWLPLQPSADRAWVAALWRAWAKQAGTESETWDAALSSRRLLNLLDYADRHGLPGPSAETLRLLAAHGPVIQAGLHWHEDGRADWRLLVDGIALAKLGLSLDMPLHAQRGFTILFAEAKRQISEAGLLKQGSTHHHLLLVRDLADLWLSARHHKRAESPHLEALLRSAFGVLPAIALPGGLPMVGSFVPDLSPWHLASLLRGHEPHDGWLGSLAEQDRQAVLALREQSQLVDLERLRADGWLRHSLGRWSGLWHGFPNGWTPAHGPGHADLGSCTLHYDNVPVFVDPGCGCGGDEGELYASASAHGGLTLDERDPYPQDDSLYNDAFRRDVAGHAPLLQAEFDGVTCQMQGYERFLGHAEVRRRWLFDAKGFTITDSLNGTGRAQLARRLITPLDVRLENGAAFISGPGLLFKVSAEDQAELSVGKVWTGWGQSHPATAITFRRRVNLPWECKLTVEVLTP